MSNILHFESDFLDQHVAEMREDAPFAAVPSLPAFSSLIGGIRHKSLSIIAGGPGSGKTTFANQIAINCILQGVPVILAEYELSPSQLVAKGVVLLSDGVMDMSEVSSAVGDAPHMNAAVERYRSEVAPRLAIVTDVRTPVELSALVAQCSQMTGQAPLLIVDYLQIMDGDPSRAYQEERLAIRDSVLGLRTIANVHGSPVIAISSVNRSSYTKANPSLDALGGCSYIEYAADLVLHLAVDGTGGERAANTALSVRPVTVTALKNRYGTCDSVELSFDTRHARFVER